MHFFYYTILKNQSEFYLIKNLVFSLLKKNKIFKFKKILLFNTENSFLFYLLTSLLKYKLIIVPTNFFFINVYRFLNSFKNIDLYYYLKLDSLKNNNINWKIFKGIKIYLNLNKSFIILKTSGANSLNKFVFHRIFGFFLNSYFVNKKIKFNSKKTWCFCLPINHVSGLSIYFRSLLSFGKIFYVKEFFLFKEKIYFTHISIVEYQFKKHFNNKKFMIFFKRSSILLGGGKISLKVINFCLRNNLNIFISYGCTETCSQISILDFKCNFIKINSSGVVFDFYNFFLNKEKIICVNSKSIFSFYLFEKKIIFSNFFFKYYNTMDLFKIDSCKFIYFISRSVNTINYCSKKIYPEEIEEIINSFLGVEKSFIFSKNDYLFGEKLMCFLIINNKFLLRDLIKFLFFKLPKYKIPFEYYEISKDFLIFEGIKLKKQRIKNILKTDHYKVLKI